MKEKLLRRNLINIRGLQLIAFSAVLYIIIYFQTNAYGKEKNIFDVVLFGKGIVSDYAEMILFVTMPFFVSYVSLYCINKDEKNNFINILLSRYTERRRYFSKKILSSMLTGGIVAITPYIIGFMIFSLKYHIINIDIFDVGVYENIFSGLMTSNPILFYFFNILVVFFFGVSTTSLTLLIKYTLKTKREVEVIMPFAIHIFIMLCSSVFYSLPFYDNMYYKDAIFVKPMGICVYIVIPIVLWGLYYVKAKNRDIL